MRAVLAALSFSLTLSLAFAGSSSAQALSEEQRAEIRDIVRDYILENPSIIEEAIVALEEQRRAEEAEALRTAIAENQEQIFSSPAHFATGPEDAPVRIVEFFDYNCGFCRRSASWVRETIETHGDDVRFVFVESPIFLQSREGSGVAARAALAARNQDRYLDLHFALMEYDGAVTPEVVMSIAEEIGLDMERLTADMEDEALHAQLDANLDAADAVGLEGTPYFIVNGEPVRGARFEDLDALIEAGANTDAG